MPAPRTAVVFVAGALAAFVGACAPEGKPNDRDAGPGGDERAVDLDFQHPGWLQDRHAIMGRWYDYEADGHTLTPRPYAWVLRDGDRDASFRIVSYYDADTAAPGRITLSFSQWTGAAWASPQSYTTSVNIKDEDVPLCVDVFAVAEVDCDGDAWQLMLRMYRDMAILSVIVIKDPGLFVRSWAGRDDLGAVRVARVDDQTDLTALPAPSTVAELADGPPSSWESTDWDFGRLAPNLPEAGMALGRRVFDDGFVGRDDPYYFLNGRFFLAKATIRPKTDGVVDDGVVIRFGADELVREDMSVAAYPELRTVEIAAPAVGDVAYVSFSSEDLQVDPDKLDGTSWPFLPPDNGAWDLAFERAGEDELRVVASPAIAVFPAQRHVCDPDAPVPLETLTPPVYVDDDEAGEPCTEE